MFRYTFLMIVTFCTLSSVAFSQPILEDRAFGNKVNSQKIDLNQRLDAENARKSVRKKFEQKVKSPIVPPKAGIFDELMPWSIDENLHPKVRENLVWIWILTALAGDFAGPLWIPQIITGLEASDGYTMDALWFWLDHFLFGIFSRSCLNCCFGIGGIVYLFHAFINYPISMINFYSRSLQMKEREKFISEQQRTKRIKKKLKCPSIKCPKVETKIQTCPESKNADIDLKKACESYEKEMILPENLKSSSTLGNQSESGAIAY